MQVKQLANRLMTEVDTRIQAGNPIGMPVVVDVVLTKACNLACTFCKDYELDGQDNVTNDQLTRIADQLFPTARRLSICSGGEPYLHKGLEHILRLAKKHDLYTWVLSNGMLLKEPKMRTLIGDELITEHGFSVDGLEPATVESIRIFAKLPVILENVQMVRRIRDELNKKFPTITIRYALMRRNIEELPAAIDYWGRNGASKLITGYLSLANGIPHDESLFFHQPLMEKVLKEARRVAERYPQLEVEWPPLVADEARLKEKPNPCLAPWRFVMIDASGFVLPCYRSFEAMRMGNIYTDDRPFKEMWQSEDYAKLRRTVNRDGEKFYPYCNTCEMRYGWGDVRSHLGDETWLDSVKTELQEKELVQIDHRRLRR